MLRTSRASMPAFIFAAHDLAHVISLGLKHRPCCALVGECMVNKIRFTLLLCEISYYSLNKIYDFVVWLFPSLPALAFLLGVGAFLIVLQTSQPSALDSRIPRSSKTE